MTTFQKDIVKIIKNGVLGSHEQITPDFDWRKGLSFCIRHGIAVIFYYGISNLSVKPPEYVMTKLEKVTHASIAQNVNQMYLIDKLKNVFNQNDIDYLFLKGSILKSMYPKSEMRIMGDSDILIKLEQYDKIESLMQGMGYEFIKESDYEIAWSKPGLFIEFHKRLIPNHDKDFYFYYGDNNWLNAQKLVNSNEYKYSDEDCYIYLFTHYTRHFRTGGIISIRHILDFYIYLLAKPDMDMDYIKSEFKKLKLLEFYENTEKTLKVWFEGAASEEVTEIITDFIFDIGSVEKLTSLEAIKQQEFNDKKISKGKRFLGTMFLPYKYMCDKYNILKKWPILLPIMWCVRFIDVLIFKRNRFGDFTKSINSLDKKQIEKQKNTLNAMGLEFNNN